MQIVCSVGHASSRMAHTTCRSNLTADLHTVSKERCCKVSTDMYRKLDRSLLQIAGTHLLWISHSLRIRLVLAGKLSLMACTQVVGHDRLKRPILYSCLQLPKNRTVEENRRHMIATFEQVLWHLHAVWLMCLVQHPEIDHMTDPSLHSDSQCSAISLGRDMQVSCELYAVRGWLSKSHRHDKSSI